MKAVLFSIILLFAFNGCESQAERDARIAQEARETLLAELEAKAAAEAKAQKAEESNSTLLRMGISKSDGVITIDTNKTKTYFERMAQQFSKEMHKFSKEFKEGKIDQENAGIEADETQIHIDLNKTEHFLEKWGKKMQDFTQEFDMLLDELDSNESNQ